MSGTIEKDKLCCLLNPNVLCLECGLRLCVVCVAPGIREANDEAFRRGIRGDHNLGPLYHEKGHCLKGANKFSISGDGLYSFWKAL